MSGPGSDDDRMLADLLAELAALRDLDRARLAMKPGSAARERATLDLDRKNAELMERFRRARPSVAAPGD